MHALYNLETATINAVGDSREYESKLYRSIRESNRFAWNQIAQHLKHAVQCGRELEHLGANFSTASPPDLVEQAAEIAADTTPLLSESQKLLDGHGEYINQFEKPAEYISRHFWEILTSQNFKMRL
jgi:hypothetical protein